MQLNSEILKSFKIVHHDYIYRCWFWLRFLFCLLCLVTWPLIRNERGRVSRHRHTVLLQSQLLNWQRKACIPNEHYVSFLRQGCLFILFISYLHCSELWMALLDHQYIYFIACIRPRSFVYRLLFWRQEKKKVDHRKFSRGKCI